MLAQTRAPSSDVGRNRRSGCGRGLRAFRKPSNVAAYLPSRALSLARIAASTCAQSGARRSCLGCVSCVDLHQARRVYGGI